ncbi:hypothetical protein ZIOFF_061338 [Zingiber officinale]|uniref:Uncharacterized protein n=1 Tax=Zingiber officinale TaxID=94328 RepID=A0A8J5EZG5_ZINOF|nr:hypothetical protein ZIOFF_061338 [Zingiber officinale]
MLCSFYLHLYDYLSLLRFWIHILMAYLFTLWTLYVLYKEYDNVAFMRLHFLASQHRRVDQFTVSSSLLTLQTPCRVKEKWAGTAAGERNDDGLPVATTREECEGVGKNSTEQ